MEHRWGQRIPVKTPVSFNVHPHVVSWMRDVSASGAFIETVPLFPVFSLLGHHVHGQRIRAVHSRLRHSRLRRGDGRRVVHVCAAGDSHVIHASKRRSPPCVWERVMHTRTSSYFTGPAIWCMFVPR